MCTKEQIEEAKKYLSDEGYGSGSNFTVNGVANLMAEWAAKKCNIHSVGVSVCDCETPYFPTGDIHYCSKCNKSTIY